MTTIEFQLTTGRRISFQQPDRAAGARLAQAFMRCASQDTAALIGFCELLALYLVTGPDPAMVARIRRALPAGHPNLLLTDRALWLGVEAARAPSDLRVIVQQLAGANAPAAAPAPQPRTRRGRRAARRALTS